MLPATEDYLSRVEDCMAETIRAMQSGPYFYTWGTVNEEDPAKQAYPSAEIRLLEETCLDDSEGAWSGTYLNEANYEIIVRATLEGEVQNSFYAINQRLNRALSDLKKVFGINYSMTPCALIMYKGMRRESERTGDTLLPVRMVTVWSVRYTQERENPLQVGDS